MTTIEFSEDAAAGVHRWLAGESNAFAALIARSRAARASGRVRWRIPVTSRTVHCLPALHAMAVDEAAAIDWEVSRPLDPRARAFLDDFLRYGPQRRSRRLARRLAELAAALREAADAALGLLPRRERPATRAEGTAVIIGVYGGDHAGDAAILGGVLQALHHRDAIRRAYVMSHRPAHTQRLLDSLRVPVEASVADYRPGAVDRLLDDACLLVLAGGPLTDLPRVLARHLAAAHAARARGVPFVIERVGIGPFRRGASRWAARRLATMARAFSVRSSADAREDGFAHLAAAVGRDPAFDYLETRMALDRADPASCRSVDALLAGTHGRRLVGVNLRPIVRGVGHTPAAQRRFMQQLADALAALAQQAGDITYVFFPMNAVQFGLSDLDAAAQVHKLLGARADFRVWEADPDVDDILYLLRRMHLAVAMRYHAAIFALSQGLPVLALDYPGAGGKVERLFHDLGEHANVCRMHAFTVPWFVSGANRLLSRPGSSAGLASSRPSAAAGG